MKIMVSNKTSAKKTIITGLFIILSFFFLPLPAEAAPNTSMSFNPDSVTVSPGEVFTVRATINPKVDTAQTANEITAIEIHFSFNSNIMEMTDIEMSTAFPQIMPISCNNQVITGPCIDNGPGGVGKASIIVWAPFDQPITTESDAAILHFTAKDLISSDTTGIVYDNTTQASAMNDNGNVIAAGGLGTASVTITPGTATPTPTIVTEPTPTPTSPAEPTPTTEPSPTETPTPTVGPGTPTVVPPTPTTIQISPTLVPMVDLSFKAKFQGILGAPPENQRAISVLVTAIDTSGQVYESSGTCNYDISVNNGLWNCKAGLALAISKSDVERNYVLLIKGPKHIQKKICDDVPTETFGGTYRCRINSSKISIPSQTVNLDFSNIVFLVGDLPEQDGVVDSYDISFIRNNLNSSDPKVIATGDLNMDGVIDTQDYSLLIAALSIRYDEE